MNETPRRRILVVDDDTLILKMLEDVLSTDFEVLVAEGGGEALDLLVRERVDCILCDQMMPQTSGIEVLKQAISVQPHAVRILLTASERVSDLSDAVNVARVHRFLVKPFRVLEVMGIVKGAVREAELERENEALVLELQQLLEQVKEREKELERELDIRTRELKDILDRLRAKNAL